MEHYSINFLGHFRVDKHILKTNSIILEWCTFQLTLWCIFHLTNTDGFKVFTIKRELHEVSTVQLSTLFGNNVTCYDLERTICDCLRSRNHMDISVITNAIKRYVKRKDKNLDALMKMAETFKVAKQLRSYMEVLL